MPKNGMNIYKSARCAAGLTQERAAECLNLGVRTLADYETGQRRPSGQTVDQMAELYGAPLLRLQHAREADELGLIPRRTVPQRFELITIQLYNGLVALADKHRGRQLLQIAADGVIDDTERPLLDEIVCELEGLSAALLALRCCAGTKKDRPDAGTSERSRTRGRENLNDTSIIPKTAPNCKPLFEGRCNK